MPDAPWGAQQHRLIQERRRPPGVQSNRGPGRENEAASWRKPSEGVSHGFAERSPNSHCFVERYPVPRNPTNNEEVKSHKIIRSTRSGLSGVLFVLAQCTFFVLWLFYVKTWMDWTSWGLLIGIISTPGVVIFPVLYWIVESTFPIGYFAVWGIGLLLGVASGALVPPKS